VVNPDLSAGLARPLRLVALGDELLRGDTSDTNSAWLAHRLSALGYTPDSIEQRPDRRGAAEAAVRRWREEGGVLVVGGGLGPTPDDATREEIAAGLGVSLAEDPRARKLIAERERRLGRRYTEETWRQARIPVGCEPVANPQGTAPAFHCAHPAANEGFLLVLPGVPREYRGLGELVFPLADGGERAAIWRLVGPGEDRLAALLADLPGSDSLGHYPSLEGHRLRVPPGAVDEAELARRLEPYLVSQSGGSLEADLVSRLRERGESLAVAESCTGGLLGARISRVPGASEVWRGGVQSYADEIKTALLGVPAVTIEEHGAVSEEVARAMVAGARERLGSDWALAVTGIAGPGGERPAKPVGTLYLALAGPPGTAPRHRHLVGGWDREGNRRFAVQQALVLLWRALRETS